MTDNYPIVDETGKTWANFNANSYTTTDQFKFGDGCLNKNGAGWIYTPWHTDFDLGDENWTIELWSRFGADASWGLAVGGEFYGDVGLFRFYYYARTANWSDMYWYYDDYDTGAHFYAEDAHAPIVANAQWYHLVWQRRGNVGDLFLNGVNLSAALDISGSTHFTPPETEFHLFPQSDPSGQIDEFLFSVGVARYDPAGFTPPTVPFTLDAYTKSLIHFDYQYTPATFGQVILWKRKGV